ncbi:MAG: hypothetical protein GPJ00_20740 [Microcystis aeruginosa W13-18]|jgi:transcriptional/translational regulatory protein YebC/TACO1|nr:hypothetical protein [Microcystis aeruginosa W13-18]NCR36949.1 hypothetical protein [Microcystis aeruginosa S11-05]NCR50473.1 hypothetical protein [Microcystis aeruginosa S11-01]
MTIFVLKLYNTFETGFSIPNDNIERAIAKGAGTWEIDILTTVNGR